MSSPWDLFGKENKTDPFGNVITKYSGGMGDYGYVSDGAGGMIGLNKAAYDSIRKTGSGGLAFGKFAPKTGGVNWFGKGGYIDSGAQVVGAIGTALQGYAALGQLGLAKKKFGFEKGVTNRNIYNQGTLVNNNMDNANNVGLALAGNTMTEAQKAASRQDTLNRHVNVSAIG